MNVSIAARFLTIAVAAVTASCTNPMLPRSVSANLDQLLLLYLAYRLLKYAPRQGRGNI